MKRKNYTNPEDYVIYPPVIGPRSIKKEELDRLLDGMTINPIRKLQISPPNSN